MMGHRERLTTGDERDALTKWRRVLRKRAGRFTSIKVRFTRRVRHSAKISTRREADQ